MHIQIVGLSLLLAFSTLGCSSSNVIKIKNLGNDVNLHTDLQLDYFDDPDYENVPQEARGKNENSYPVPVQLSWTSEIIERTFTVEISETKDFSVVDSCQTNENSLDVYNLKVDTTYYWRVKGHRDISETASFITSDVGFRNLYVPGMTNCRDIGGKDLKSGKRLVQGNIFRTGCADDITKEGIEAAKHLGWKTEIDLRQESTITSSPLGNNVRYFNYKCYYEGEYQNYVERNCVPLREVFRLLADESSYPIFYHCQIGTDRTGFTTYLLLGLLGVPEETIYRDYLFSNFATIGTYRKMTGSDINNVQLYYSAIDAFPGRTLQERCYNFLSSIGVTAYELDNIVRLNVEDYDEAEDVILADDRPEIATAKDFDLADGIEFGSYEGLRYVDLDEKKDLSIGAYFSLSDERDYALYLYLYASHPSIKVNAALEISLDSNHVEIPSFSFNTLHYRATKGVFVAARFAEFHLSAGDCEIAVKNIAGTGNTNAYGIYLASVVLIPML